MMLNGPVLLESYAPGGQGRSFTFDRPVNEVVALEVGDVRSALIAVEEAVDKGLHAAGFLCYEAAAGLDKARVLVAAMDNPTSVTQLVKYARKFRPDLHIVARARDRRHTYELYQAGADDIVRETFDSSLRAGRYVLENIGFTDFEASKLEDAFYHHDRDTIRELAELWDPDVPADQNPEYVARSKELERDLEAALQALLSRDEDAA